jgi:KaiC/GvpD/RAD55 family RecA-like ATPase
MSEVELVSTGSSGLDLVLGGGLAFLDRGGDGASGSLLIRGGAGAGKTILALQLASHLAKHRGGDVAYGCVELLPVELAAQHRSVFGEDEVVGPLPVVPASGSAKEPFGSAGDRAGVSILAAVLDLGATSAEHEHLGAAVEALLDGCKASGSEPRVLVIDSLVSSYGLGADAPRAVIDGLVKLAAQRGLFLIVAEESGADAGEWRFAVDTVIELQHGPAGPSRISERDLFVTKHRFAKSEVGPHPYVIAGRGVATAPSLRSYGAQFDFWSTEDDPPMSADWNFEGLTPPRWNGNPRDGISAVFGPDELLVREFALQLARDSAEEDLWLDFGAGSSFSAGAPPLTALSLADPMMRGEQFIHGALQLLETSPRVTRVVVGDLSSLDSFADPRAMQRAVARFAAIARRRAFKVILFQTTSDGRPAASVGWSDFNFRVDFRIDGKVARARFWAWSRNGERHGAPLAGFEAPPLRDVTG